MLNRFYLFIFLFISLLVNGQLADFQLQLTGSNEICSGNGTLQINTTNTTAGSTMSFLIYKLPDLSTPIATTQNLNGLSNGTYRVIATQTLGSTFNTQQQDYTIQNLITSLTFNVTATNVLNCNGTGAIIINTLTGVANSYQIILGPQTFPV